MAVLSADRLRAIVDRSIASYIRGVDKRDAAAVRQVLSDRTDLLALLRRVASYNVAEEGHGYYCPYCAAEVFGPPEARLSLAQDHAADCPAPALEVLRGTP